MGWQAARAGLTRRRVRLVWRRREFARPNHKDLRMSLAHGRPYLAIPGTAVMPDAVLRALHASSSL